LTLSKLHAIISFNDSQTRNPGGQHRESSINPLNCSFFVRKKSNNFMELLEPT